MNELIVIFSPVAISVVVAGLAEFFAPVRAHDHRATRRFQSVCLYFSGVFSVFILVPGGQIAAIQFSQIENWGLLNWAPFPVWMRILIAVAALDFGEWLVHNLLHKSPFLWRIHRVHHSDQTLDIATGFRFHPIETVLRYVVGILVILLVGVPMLAVTVYAALTIAFNAWEHANVRVPRALRAIHPILMTPELHRVHHSDLQEHMNSNFGVIFSVWDTVFGSKVVVAGTENDSLSFGIGSRDKKTTGTLVGLLADPFKNSGE